VNVRTYSLTLLRIDGTLLSWSVDLGKNLLSLYPLPEGVIPIPSDVLLPPKHLLQLIEDIDSPNSEQEIRSQPSGASIQPRGEEIPTALLPSQTSERIERLSTKPREFKSSFDMEYVPPVEVSIPDPCEQLKEKLEGENDPVDSHLPSPDLLPIPEGFEVTLIENKRLTPEDHWQDVRQLTFHIPDEFDYMPGESVTIYPKNFPEDVQTLIDLMDWNEVADKPLKFKNQIQYPHSDIGDPDLVSNVPGLYPLKHTTLRQLLIHNLDITAIPKRFFFEIIAHHSSDPVHKERLLEFTNPAFTDEFYDYTTRPRRSILEVLHDFPSVKLPWQWVTNIFPVIRGRSYSISSGGLLQQTRQKGMIAVQLLVAIVKYKTVLRKVRQGLCSRYLASLLPGTSLTIELSSDNAFYKYAKLAPKHPIILIAPGTGLAPCRSLIWERSQELHRGKIIGSAYLFYGGRNKDADYFYKDEWKDRALKTTVFTAFSRDQKEKIYVQDIIRREGKLILDLINRQNAIIFVCGSSGSMPKAVKEALIDACYENLPKGKGRSREFIAKEFENYERNGRYVQETW